MKAEGDPLTRAAEPGTGVAQLDPHRGLQALIEALLADGYRVVGPVERDGVIVYDDLTDAAQLPVGCTVEQQPGRWRLHHTDDTHRFHWTPGADSWKQFVFPAGIEVLRIRRTDGTWVVTGPQVPSRPLAIIGARDCELRALAILDEVLLGGQHPDPLYAARRADMFVVAVTCAAPSATCWCTSMGGGPEPRDGFDLALTELPQSGEPPTPHDLLASAGSERGRALLARLPVAPATDATLAAARRVVQGATEAMPQRLPGERLPELLAGSELHPHWDAVAQRCLSCGNCTLVCPTCFCSTYTDHTPLGTGDAVREQTWASCFEVEHSNLGGRPVRATTAARYRQWLLHKLQTWPEQFGTPGCVGCGRCTTWCPAAIDLVEEATVLIGGRQ